MNAKIIEEHSKEIAKSVKRSKTSTQTTTKNHITKTTLTAEKEVKEEENGFFRKYLLRNSKRGQKTTDECDTKKEEKVQPPTEEYKMKVEETRKEIRREILSEKSGLSGMLGSFILSQEKEAEKAEKAQAITKPKSSAATRQRVTPKDIKDETAEFIRKEGVKYKARSISESSDSNEGTPKKVALNRSYKEEIFQSTTLVKEITKKEHFDKRSSHQPRIVGLNSFQQKICKSNDSLANSSDSSDLFEGFNNRRRPSVEKSKSFRSYSDKAVEKDSMALGFQINDNKLLKQKPESLPLSQGIYTKNIILTTSTSNNHTPKKILSPVSPIAHMDISEIEDSIDKIVKAPFITVIRNSGDETTLKAPVLGSPLKERLENYEKNFASPPTTHVKNKIRISVNEKVDEQKVVEKVMEQTVPEKVMEQKVERRVSEKVMEQKVERRVSEKLMERNAREQKVVEQKVAEKVMERKVREQKVEQKVPEKAIREQKASEQKVAEQKVSEQKVVEPKATERKVAQPKATERKIVQPKFIERKVAQPKVSEKKITEKKVTQRITEQKIVENGKSDSFQFDDLPVVLRPKPTNSVSLAPSITRISANFSHRKEPTIATLDRRIELSKSSDSLNESSTDVSNGLKAKSNSFNRPRRSSSISCENASILPEFMKIQLNRVDPSRPKSSILMARKCKLEEDGKSLSNESVEITDNDKEPSSLTPEPEREKPKKQVSLEEPLIPREESSVILRKKSFVLNLTQSNSMISVRDDATPELMKVFARRSLKVKDEDIQNMNLELNQSKQVPNVDSDKENQSASDEKLDKLVKNDAENTTTTTKFSQKLDNRTSLSKISDTNNNNSSNVPTTPLRHSANSFRLQQSADERNNNNNIVSTKYRHSTAFSPPTSPTDKNSPPCITTPSCEFKGIHQMRAEWEKRAKEAALK